MEDLGWPVMLFLLSNQVVLPSALNIKCFKFSRTPPRLLSSFLFFNYLIYRTFGYECKTHFDSLPDCFCKKSIEDVKQAMVSPFWGSVRINHREILLTLIKSLKNKNHLIAIKTPLNYDVLMIWVKILCKKNWYKIKYSFG